MAAVHKAHKLLSPDAEPMPASQNISREVSQENRQDHPVVQHLQREVANAFVLYANYKH